jgi:hypothetical protein
VRPPLTVAQILAWADAYHARNGHWPKQRSGAIGGGVGLTWGHIDAALRRGELGLPGGDSLAKLLARERGARNPKALPPLTVGRILDWADAHRGRTGRWPNADSGPVLDAPGETWRGIHGALYSGHRGLPGGESLAGLLDRRRRGKPGGRRRSPPRPWTPQEDEWVRTLLPDQAAERSGRSLRAVYGRRQALGVPGRQGRRPRAWTAAEDAMVRSLPAREVARRTGRSQSSVYDRRHALGVGRRYRSRTRRT